jgi:hypothetical protein
VAARAGNLILRALRGRTLRGVVTVVFVAVARALGGKPLRLKPEPKNLPAQVERDQG